MRFIKNIARKVFVAICLLHFSTQALADVPVSGIVKDQNGKTLEGVTIQIKGTDLAAITNSKGEYKLEVPKDATLVYSSIGLKTVEKKVDRNTSKIDLTLEDDSQQLAQNIVFGSFF
ncbi:MAG: carboxypeptidase-like regulatory domain-containing protein [Cyclobacteriaceae bacterium]|nr:carboxypeptidase-like regulatory domain-containing protein [Cyclobacteriaceae bacterium SS2]